MPPKNQPLNENHILQYARKWSHFRGVFARDEMPERCNENESGVINLDSKQGAGTHWVAYFKIANAAFYFDSFGDLRPPNELIDYLGGETRIYYNYTKDQDYNTVNCGHLCLKFLEERNSDLIKANKQRKHI